MEELMAKLRENLVKGREQVAAKEDVENVFKEGGPVQEVLVAEIKNGSEDAFKKEDVVLDDSVEARKQVATGKDVMNMVQEEGLGIEEEGAEMNAEHDFDDMFVKDKVVVEKVLVEEVVKEKGVVKLKDKVHMKGEHGLEDTFAKEEVAIEDLQVEEVKERVCTRRKKTFLRSYSSKRRTR